MGLSFFGKFIIKIGFFMATSSIFPYSILGPDSSNIGDMAAFPIQQEGN